MDAGEDTRSTTSSTTVAKEDAPTVRGETKPTEGSSIEPNDSLETQDTQNEEGDALEEGEILELQAFIPRRQWIEEKIQLLESLPSVELFDHLEFLVAQSPEPIQGLPTREQLASWQDEHDATEHEAEQFDSNDMKRLKKFAKAATQRNLSPADTDLIEVTLTTLLALDKLIHLLRARSDTLEFTGLRLTWEEKRIAAWKERNAIREELRTFVTEQARWSVSNYDKIEMSHSDTNLSLPASASRTLLSSSVNGQSPSPSPLASDSTPRRNSNVTVVSRGARYKFAEDLTREAGRFTTRYSAVKRNHITAAGKALDKMIEKKNLPDEVLDEQDRLENDIRPMDSLAKFAMDMITQWKKADEIYGELKKDQVSASMLCDEVEDAMSHHPTTRQDTTFLARSQALGQRLNAYPDLKNPRLFPRPIHPNFLDQVSCNEKIVAELTSEQIRTRELVQEASKVAVRYHRILEAVKGVEECTTQLQRHILTLENCENRLLDGTVVPDGDGSPINLDLVACLEPLTHGAYLALLPHTNAEIDAATKGGASAANTCRSLLRSLQKATLDAEFSAEVNALLQTFDEATQRVGKVKIQALEKATHLRDIRRVWAAIAEETEIADGLKTELADTMERCKWRPMGQAPVTPAVTTVPNSPWATPDVSNRIEALSSRIAPTIAVPFERTRTFLGKDVVDEVLGSTGGLVQYLDSLKGMGRLCEAIQRQSNVMFGIQHEALTLEQRMEALSQQFERARDHLLQASSSLDEGILTQEQLEQDDAKVAADVAAFVDSLSIRVPFLGRSNSYFSGPTRKSSLVAGTRSDSLSISSPFLLPFDTASLDHVVRTDANNISMHLSSKVQGLSKQLDYLRLARLARNIDLQLHDIAAEVHQFQRNLEEQQQTLEELPSGEALEEEVEERLLERLRVLQRVVHPLASHGRDALQASLGPIRSSLHQLLEHPGAQDGPVHDTVVAPRLDQSKNLEALVAQACQHAQTLKDRIDAAFAQEQSRVDHLLQEKAEREKLAAEERAREEEEERLRREAEEAERRRLEEGRLRKEDEDRLRREEEIRQEEVRLEALRLAELERQRLEAQRLEQLRLEQLRREEQEAARLEAIRLTELEKQRLEAERLERLRLEELRRKEEAERRRQEELERSQREREERERLRRLQEEEEIRIKREQEAAETLRKDEEEETRQREAEAQAERERIAAEEEERRRREDIERLEREETERRVKDAEAERQAPPTLQDAFTLQIAPPTPVIRSEEAQRLQIQIAELRARLRSLNLHSWARPSPDSAHASILPSVDLITNIQSTFTEIQSTAQSFPSTIADCVAVEAELHSLHFELDRSKDLLERCRTLAMAASRISECDAALSDLLEHIDSYPGEPFDTTSSHIPNPEHTPQEKLAARLTFTQELLDSLGTLIKSTQDDPRLLSERERLDQTWQELQEMTADRLAERTSQPTTDSEPGGPSGRGSSASVASASESSDALSKTGTRPPSKKPRGILGIHRQPSSRAMPSSPTPPPKQRPGHTEKLVRRTPSTSSTRSVSGPLVSSNSNILAPTFASRQRTTSTSSVGDNLITSLRKIARVPPSPVQRLRSILGPSPTPSESSTSSRTPYTPRSTSVYIPTHRAATKSLSRSYSGRPSGDRTVTPRRLPERKKYIPNKKNRLDVAVGRIVNTLPVHVSIEHVSGGGGDGGWEDKSGRYWIGDEDPRLCFCRILRSQTVMVRVGGGWVELSKFIKDHFAHLFRLLPESTGSPRGLSKEKWISAATLQEEAGPSSPSRAGSTTSSHLQTPSTPERKHHNPLAPSILLNTPGGTPPRSISSSTGSSPLTALQFLRRVDEGVPGMGLGGPPLAGGPPFGPMLSTIPLPPRSGTPSRPGPHHKPTPRSVSAKQPVWRF